MRAKEIMSHPVFTLRVDDTIEHAAEVLAGNGITAAPVLDQDGNLVGMVSEGDLLWHRVPADPVAHVWRAAAGDAEPRTRLVREVMSRHPVTAWPAADIADIAQMMLRHNVRSVPIVSGGDVVGIVSRRDLVRAAIRTDDVLRAEIQLRLDDYASVPGRWTVTVSEGTATIDGVVTNDAERTIITVLARTVPGVAAVQLSPVGAGTRA